MIWSGDRHWYDHSHTWIFCWITIQLKLLDKYSLFTGHTKEMLCPLMKSWKIYILTRKHRDNKYEFHSQYRYFRYIWQPNFNFLLLFYLSKSTAEAGRTPVSDFSTFSFVSRYFLTFCTSIGNCGLWYLSRAATILDLYSFSLLHITTNLYLIPKMERQSTSYYFCYPWSYILHKNFFLSANQYL